jgi:hypothetical protein
MTSATKKSPDRWPVMVDDDLDQKLKQLSSKEWIERLSKSSKVLKKALPHQKKALDHAREHDRLKVWCGRCWAYVDPPHDCKNIHRPLRDEPKLSFP